MGKKGKEEFKHGTNARGEEAMGTVTVMTTIVMTMRKTMQQQQQQQQQH